MPKGLAGQGVLAYTAPTSQVGVGPDGEKSRHASTG